MSRITDMGINFKQIPQLIAEYDDELELAPSRLAIKGKLLEVAQQEQCAWPLYYRVRQAELKTLVRYMEAQVASVRGKLLKAFKEAMSLDVGERILNSYVNNADEYIKIHVLELEVTELYEKYCAVEDAFTKRGFALRDLTTAKVNALHDLPI